MQTCKNHKMKDLVAAFTNQLKEAVEIGKKSTVKAHDGAIKNVIITGLGGSGIGGTLLTELAKDECPVPIVVNKDYFLPAFANENTLVIASSYSGNTEETLSAFEDAVLRSAKIICISSGGILLQRCEELSIPFIRIPGGMPPRACLAYSLVQLFFVMHKEELISGNFLDSILNSISELDANETSIMADAKALAQKLIGKIPVIYTSAPIEGVAIRFRQQINENSKMLCWHHVLPEMNHNELVGWTEKHHNLAVVMLRDQGEYERTSTRFNITSDIIRKFVPEVIEVNSIGNNALERTLYLIHLLDWVSVYIAEIREIDANEVNVINHLKNTLADS